MYELIFLNKRAKKRLQFYIKLRKDILSKLERLKDDPRRNLGAHMLGGEFAGKWSCWLGSNIRLIYIINDEQRRIEVEVVGSHKIY